MRRIVEKLFIFSLLLSVVLLTSCGNTNTEESQKTPETSITDTSKTSQTKDSEESKKNESHYPVTIKTYRHSKEPIEITFDKAPEKVYAVWSNSIDNMIALGLEDKIAMMTTGSSEKIPENWENLYDKIGASPSVVTKEEVLGNNIDFILGWYSTFDDKALGEVDYWHDKGINTYIALNSSIKKPAPNTLEDEYEDIRNLGKIFNVEDRAEKIINEMEEKIAMAQEKVKEHGKTKTIILEVEKDNQLRLYGPETIGGVIAEKVGADLLTNEPRITAEELIALNPDVIFTVHFGEGSRLTPEDSINNVINNPAFGSISAVQNGRVYPISLAYTYTPGVRASEGIEYMIKKLYNN